jgi:hypothetical protein
MTVEFLNTAELAARWRLSVKTLTNWRVKRVGPRWRKLGAGRNARVVYPMAEIVAFEAGEGAVDKGAA